MNSLKVLTEQTDGAVFSALAGGEHSTSDHVEAVITGSVRASRGVLPPVLLEKRMIDKIIMVLKVVIVLLELIRIFF
ncbi:hypothetical protein M977_04690 [Buttiauxella gaviniae ATCC 51604]|uniref:Uncharacterized protein n=1 Tax=Buttiauxella gaviniae ATCC 51604 TaxID=1354253 RepID=A0A1B7HJ65_9ENTR|nr:damage-inducible type I toxin DinQ [Buttiauxella gaviniae]OAT15684.1 hypothetical protein M977_04690 [Buttiauxella gaviniae ATCC 51604]